MIRAGFLVGLLGCGIAAAAVPEPAGFRMDDYRAPVPETVAGGVVIHAAQIQALQHRHAVVLIDVVAAPRRPEGMRADMPWLPPAHRDLPGSLWWPDIGRGAISAALADRLRERLGALTAAHPDELIVFYCKSDCWLSWNATKRAASWGVHAGWFPEGADGWEQDGLPMQDAQPEFLD